MLWVTRNKFDEVIVFTTPPSYDGTDWYTPDPDADTLYLATIAYPEVACGTCVSLVSLVPQPAAVAAIPPVTHERRPRRRVAGKAS
jgi:hypothetical protein